MMTRQEEYQRLLEDRDEKENEIAYIEDMIRRGDMDEDEEYSYVNALENEIMYISSLIEEYEEDMDV